MAFKAGTTEPCPYHGAEEPCPKLGLNYCQRARALRRQRKYEQAKLLEAYFQGGEEAYRAMKKRLNL